MTLNLPPPRIKRFAVPLLIFVASLAWFWFWRPYGFYGGDSEYLDRQINGGLWFRKREPLAVAAMQLSRQIVTLRFGWPVSWAISAASCFFGAVSMVVLWRLCRDWTRPVLGFSLVACSGYILLYHGSIEAYALPTMMVSFWILAIRRVGTGRWPTWTIPSVFAVMVWSHLIGFFLFPALLVSAWTYRIRVRKEWAQWALALVVASWVYIFTNQLNIGEGLGFEGIGKLFADSGQKEFGPFFSWKHLQIKLTFLWIGTHLTLPFALLAIWKWRTNREILQIGALALCSLGFLIVFHPDTGYRDWDLFSLPSLPVAVLGARYVVRSPWWRVWLMVWMIGFFAVWVPRVPGWARLSERGLATVTISNFPEDRRVKVDHRYPVSSPNFYVQGGTHTLSIMKTGETTLMKDFKVAPGNEMTIEVPTDSVPVPFAEQIRALKNEENRQPLD